MKAKILGRNLVALAVSCLLCISCLSVTVFARGHIDIDRPASLQMFFGEDGKGFSNVEFRIYRVAEITEAGDFVLSETFREYPVELNNLDSSGWRTLAQTLDAYVARDNINPYWAKKTEQTGNVHFSDLPTGLYLVAGDTYTQDTTIYTPEPTLISLPGMTEKDQWTYDVEAFCKFNRETIPEFVERKVQKVWKDDGNSDKRPKEISVQLLKNGEIVDTVVLNNENNWEYVWKDLDGRSKWQVTEAVTPAGYTVSVKQEGLIFVMTNTCPPETPPKLPQTGMLWWPVPLLLCVGLLLVVTGLWVRRRQGDPNEK